MKKPPFLLFAALLVAISAPDAFASLGTSGLPTDTGFQMIYNFMTGEYAYLASIAGAVSYTHLTLPTML